MTLIKFLFLAAIMVVPLYAVHGASSKRGTVVLVHGFMGNRAQLFPIAISLRCHGFRVINWSYRSRRHTIETHSEALTKRLRKIAKKNPGEPIHFVAHSMGGLVLRSALNRDDCPEEARLGTGVLLATPNQGSAHARHLGKYRLARWILGDQSGRQLMDTPEGGFARLGTFPTSMRVLVIAGDFGFSPWIPGPDDGKVGVAETRLSTPYTSRTVHAGHCWLSLAPTVVLNTRRFLVAGTRKVNERAKL